MRVLLAVTGGVAAYKSAVLARELMRMGAEVRVLMTSGARQFITPLTFQALTHNPVHTELLDETQEAGMGHIQLARWAQLMLVAPASANSLSRMAAGAAEDLLGAVYLATEAKVLVAPAMNMHMWQHPSTRRNLATLRQDGVVVCQPASGEQACGDVGAGRMPEPEQLAAWALAQASSSADAGLLADKRILISAGPTVEAIDPVRYLSNHSSGKMGYAVALAAAAAGAKVTLVSGKVALDPPLGVKLVSVLSAEQMLEACRSMAASHDCFIATAAVADYRTREVTPQKIKKAHDEMTLDLVKNPDILKTLAHEFKDLKCVGFAAETQKTEEYALGKLKNKNLAAVVCNDVSRSDIGFGSDFNAATVYFKGGEHLALERASKQRIAEQLIQALAERVL